MVFGGKGYVGKGLYILGLPWTPSYLLDCSRPVLFEAGFSCLGRLYEEDIRKVLNSRQPEILFLTHVHYDHCGATAYFKKVFPDIKVAASSKAAEIIKRPNALKLIKELSTNVTSRVTAIKNIDATKLLYEPFEPFEIDIVLENGETFQLTEDINVKIFVTAGHTRDNLAYYIPEKKILFVTESVGNIDRVGRVITEFLVDYDAYIEDIKRFSLFDIEILCLGHQFVVTDADVKGFFTRSQKEAEDFKTRVERYLIEEGGDIDKVVRHIKAEDYDTNPGPKQMEQAYLINLTIQVTHLAKHYLKLQCSKMTCFL
ncbi:MAG TPA: hypothetical protein DDW17_03745 [Deltaproteobacteria bacterium]|nr:hypothetical protein [Deltaproteobacteria bacterium]